MPPTINPNCFDSRAARLILETGATGGKINKHKIISKVIELNGMRSTPSSSFSTLGKVLKFLRTKMRGNTEQYDVWLKDLGIHDYVRSQPLSKDSFDYLTWLAILDPSNKDLFHFDRVTQVFKTAICRKKFRREGPFSPRDIVNVNNYVQMLKKCIAVLDTHDVYKTQWEDIREMVGLTDITNRPQLKGNVLDYRNVKKDAKIQANVLFSYPGCKRRSAYDIIARLNVPEDGKVREAFCGTGAVSLILKANRPDVQLWLNDGYLPLVSLLLLVRDNPQQLRQKYIDCTPNAEEWSKFNKMLEDPTLPTEELGWMFFYVMTFSKAGIGLKFGTKTKNYGDRYTCEPALMFKKIATVSKLLQGAKITCQDFREVLVEPWGIDYVDPPYTNATRQYRKVFEWTEHRDLQRVLMALNTPWLLSYDDDDQEYVRTLYTRCKIEGVKSARSQGGSSRFFPELFICR